MVSNPQVEAGFFGVIGDGADYSDAEINYFEASEEQSAIGPYYKHVIPHSQQVQVAARVESIPFHRYDYETDEGYEQGVDYSEPEEIDGDEDWDAVPKITTPQAVAELSSSEASLDGTASPPTSPGWTPVSYTTGESGSSEYETALEILDGGSEYYSVDEGNGLPAVDEDDEFQEADEGNALRDFYNEWSDTHCQWCGENCMVPGPDVEVAADI